MKWRGYQVVVIFTPFRLQFHSPVGCQTFMMSYYFILNKNGNGTITSVGFYCLYCRTNDWLKKHYQQYCIFSLFTSVSHVNICQLIFKFLHPCKNVSPYQIPIILYSKLGASGFSFSMSAYWKNQLAQTDINWFCIFEWCNKGIWAVACRSMIAFPEDYKTLVPRLLSETMTAIGSSFISHINLAIGEAVPETKALAKGCSWIF